MIELTKDLFIKNIYDYITNADHWKYKSNVPSVIDFYADWCLPCKNMLPIITEMEKNNSNINFFTVNVDKENELVQLFEIKSIPTFMFIPINDYPSIFPGILSRYKFKRILDDMINNIDIYNNFI